MLPLLARQFILAAACSLLTLAHGQALTLYVSPAGSDAWSGQLDQPNEPRTDGPLASLGGARDALRRLRQAGPIEGSEIKVVVADGTYTLAEPLVLDPIDSGREDQVVTFEAAPGAHPLFTGGRKITGFRPVAGGLWQVELPEVRDGKWNFEQLYINGHRATRARTPNTGFFQVKAPASEPVAGVPLAGPLDRTALVLRAEDLTTLAGVTPDEVHDVNAIVYHSWATSRHRLAGWDAEHGTVQFTGAALGSFFQTEPYHRIVLENYRAALDAPGEWFLDRKGVLLYQPLPGERADHAEAYAPAIGRWLVLRGEPEKGRFVEYVQWKGLSFADSQFLLGPGGWMDPQAESGLGAAIEADGTRHVVFENCDFSRLGTYGLWFRHGCSDARVTHCYFHEMAAGGVKIGETGIPQSEAAQTHHVTVENCIIQGGGRYFNAAEGVWIGHSGDNSIIHNDIGDFYYSAISVGWIWGFQKSLAVRNRIEGNHLHHLGWGVLSDLGAVYTLGPAPGTVVRGNRVHDISCYSYGGWGLYPDEGTSDTIWENNLVYRTESGGFHQHYGKNNLIRNNIFASAREMQLRHSRSEDHLAFTFESNIVLWSEGKLLGHVDASWQGEQVKLARNLYWQTEQAQYDFAGKSREQWQASGQDEGSVFADPRFVDAEKGDFDLPADSPALALGFHPFPYAEAGVTGDPAWLKLAAARQYPPMDFSPLDLEPPPLQLHEGFEYIKPGPHFTSLVVHPGSKVENITVTDQLASEGKQCLQITDGPETTPSWDPHFYYEPRHKMGVSTVSFDLRVAPAAEINIEWRNNALPYLTGPHLEFRGGVLSCSGRKLMDLPALTWVHLEMEAHLGGHASGTWTLRATPAEQKPSIFDDLKFADADAKTLSWFGFVSVGTQPAHYWLDAIDIRNEVKQ